MNSEDKVFLVSSANISSDKFVCAMRLNLGNLSVSDEIFRDQTLTKDFRLETFCWVNRAFDVPASNASATPLICLNSLESNQIFTKMFEN